MLLEICIWSVFLFISGTLKDKGFCSLQRDSSRELGIGWEGEWVVMKLQPAQYRSTFLPWLSLLHARFCLCASHKRGHILLRHHPLLALVTCQKNTIPNVSHANKNIHVRLSTKSSPCLGFANIFHFSYVIDKLPPQGDETLLPKHVAQYCDRGECYLL